MRSGRGTNDREARIEQVLFGGAAPGAERPRGDDDDAAADHAVDELRLALASAVGWIAGTGPVGEQQFELAPDLRVLARYGVGVDNVDLAAASRSIIVTNTPGANSPAVIEHTVALMLAALRGIPAADRRVRAGDWSPTLARELSSLTVGVVGLGRIGRGVVDRVSAFGAELLGADPYVPAWMHRLD